MNNQARFPDSVIDEISEYSTKYVQEYAAAARTINGSSLRSASELVLQTVNSGGTIFSCGNGGSAAISNHLLCDFAKGIQTDTQLRPRVVSLSSHTELLLAISNDIAFEDAFAYQLRSWCRKGDLLLAISSSGNSENIIRAINDAKHAGIPTIALTGFSGGRASQAVDINVHVQCENYGVVEDLHQSIMHIIAQFIRLKHMDPALIQQRRF